MMALLPVSVEHTPPVRTLGGDNQDKVRGRCSENRGGKGLVYERFGQGSALCRPGELTLRSTLEYETLPKFCRMDTSFEPVFSFLVFVVFSRRVWGRPRKSRSTTGTRVEPKQVS